MTGYKDKPGQNMSNVLQHLEVIRSRRHWLICKLELKSQTCDLLTALLLYWGLRESYMREHIDCCLDSILLLCCAGLIINRVEAYVSQSTLQEVPDSESKLTLRSCHSTPWRQYPQKCHHSAAENFVMEKSLYLHHSRRMWVTENQVQCIKWISVSHTNHPFLGPRVLKRFCSVYYWW